MGIGLNEIIPKKEIKWEKLNGKIFAVDASQMLYQFLSSIRQSDGTPLMDSKENITSHLVGLASRVPNLMEKGLRLAFVFDGKPPELKNAERERRSERKEIAEQRMHEAEDEEESLRYAKQTVRVTKEMMEESKRLLEAFGVPVVQSPSEAEAQCSEICKQGKADYVSSTDYDVLVYGAPRMIRNLTLSTQRKFASGAYKNVYPEVIELKEVLNELGLNLEQFKMMSILIGTDYNPKGVKGIGPKKALDAVKKYKDYDLMFKELKAEFDWKEVSDVFSKMPVDKNVNLVWGMINETKVARILIDEHDFNEERVTKMLKKITISKKTINQKGLGEFIY